MKTVYSVSRGVVSTRELLKETPTAYRVKRRSGSGSGSMLMQKQRRVHWHSTQNERVFATEKSFLCQEEAKTYARLQINGLRLHYMSQLERLVGLVNSV